MSPTSPPSVRWRQRGARGYSSPSGQQHHYDSSPQRQQNVPDSIGDAVAKRRDGALGGFLDGGKRRCGGPGASTYAEQNPRMHLEQAMTDQNANQVRDQHSEQCRR